MNSSVIKLEKVFSEKRGGDWGKSQPSGEYTKPVYCIRGADIDNINSKNLGSLPLRYVKPSVVKSKSLTAKSIVIEISGGSPTQSTGRVARVDDEVIGKLNYPIICTNFCRALLVKEEYDPEYIYYWLKNLYRNNVFFNFEGKTTGIKNLDLDTFLNSVNIAMPPKLAQESISGLIAYIDSKIILNNKINAELEQTARLIYDYWFTQFDFPDAQGKPYKSSGGAMVYNDQLKRKIPTDWNHIEIGDISQLIRGVSYNKTQIENTLDADTVKILRATNITGNTVDIDEPVLVSKSLVEPKQFLNKYDILMTMSSGSIEHIGKNGFYYLDEKVAFGAFCAKILPKINHRFYLYMFMQSAHLKVMIKNECLGTNINNLNASMVNGFKLVGPDSDTISAFNKTVEPMFREIENNVRQNQQLAQLRDWLLPMLMTGQVKVL